MCFVIQRMSSGTLTKTWIPHQEGHRGHLTDPMTQTEGENVGEEIDIIQETVDLDHIGQSLDQDLGQGHLDQGQLNHTVGGGHGQDLHILVLGPHGHTVEEGQSHQVPDIQGHL